MQKEEFKELRLKLKMSQNDFGKAIGLSKSGVSNIENGLRKITAKHEKLVNAAFGKNTDEIDLTLIPTDDLLAELKRRCSS